MGSANREERTIAGVAQVRWKTVAICGLVSTLVSLTVLAIVPTISGADALSVVALALAVMAFVVQIIVYIVQGNAAVRQAADTAALNAQTLRALATIEEKSEGTRRTVGVMNERILEFALAKASAEVSSSEGADVPVPVSPQVIERANEILNAGDSSGERSRSTRNRVKNSWAADGPPPTSSMNIPLTEDEVTIVEKILEKHKADTLTLQTLHRMGTDKLNADLAGRPGAAGFTSINRVQELYTAGLIKRLRTDRARSLYLLTEQGELVARALISQPAPTNATIAEARKKVSAFQESLKLTRARQAAQEEKIPITDARS